MVVCHCHDIFAGNIDIEIDGYIYLGLCNVTVNSKNELIFK